MDWPLKANIFAERLHSEKVCLKVVPGLPSDPDDQYEDTDYIVEQYK